MHILALAHPALNTIIHDVGERFMSWERRQRVVANFFCRKLSRRLMRLLKGGGGRGEGLYSRLLHSSAMILRSHVFQTSFEGVHLPFFSRPIIHLYIFVHFLFVCRYSAKFCGCCHGLGALFSWY